MDDIRSESITHFPTICWRSVQTGEVLTGIDLSVTSEDNDRMSILPLNEILQIMLRHLREKYSAYVTLLFNHKVVDVQQDAASAWATVEAAAGHGDKEEKRFEADYVIGCDGGQSMVRKLLFQRQWPGETFESRLLVQNASLSSFTEPYGSSVVTVTIHFCRTMLTIIYYRYTIVDSRTMGGRAAII